jgi:hypothetical protein
MPLFSNPGVSFLNARNQLVESARSYAIALPTFLPSVQLGKCSVRLGQSRLRADSRS